MAGSKTPSAGNSGPALRWLEIAVEANAEAVEAVSEILDRVGYNGIAVEEPIEPVPAGPGVGARVADHLVKAYIAQDHAARAKVRRVRDAIGHLRAFGLGPVGEVRLRAVADENWLESWKRSVTPIRVGAFLVRPTWSDAEVGDATLLSLDPGMAFGTGLHPTTQQCLEALSTLRLDGRRVLDVGTGSGILAIAAAKRGANEVVAVDTDELAVRATRENATANGVALDVRCGSAADVAGTFDVVLANIVGPVLERIAPDLRARVRASGTLVAAGIVADAEPGVRSAFDRAGFRLVERDQRSDWIRMMLTV